VAEHDSVIPAGGSGRLTAKITTSPSQRGRVSKSINVGTDAADARSLRLRFTVDVWAPIVAKPRLRLTATGLEGEEIRARILLHRADGEPLEISSVETGNSAVRPQVDRVTQEERNSGTTTEERDLWLEVVSNQDAAPGMLTGMVRVATNHPDVPELLVPFSIRIRSLIEAQPAGVRMWLPQAGGREGQSTIMTLKRNGNFEFTITAIEVSHPEIFTAAANSTAPAVRQAVRVNLVDDLSRDTLRATVEGWIVVRTDDPEKPMVEIPVIVSPTRASARRPLPRR
jgi:hypothetical protein